MRSHILRTVAALLALTLAAGVGAAQGRKRRAKAKPPLASQSGTTKTPQPYTGDPIPPPQVSEPQSDGARRITPAAARAAQEKGTAIIIDVRNEQVYNSGHVKGAKLIPYGDVAARIKELPRNKLIITYCS